MALHLLDDPKGIDFKVQGIQRSIEPKIVENWGATDVYGRAYKIRDKEDIRLEIYCDNNEYRPILYSEGNKIFFIQGDTPKLEHGRASNDLWAIAVLKLGEDREREDEQSHIDLVTELVKVVGTDNVIGLEYGMNNLKRVVEDPFETGNFKYSDIHPYHVFMVKMNVGYELIENNC